METLQAIKLRKSTRKFEPKPIPSEVLEQILSAGNEAPVGMAAYDRMHLTVVHNQPLLQKIGAFSGGEPFYGAPVVIFVSAKMTDSPAIEYANSACLVENMCLAATDLNVDSVYVWGALKVFISEPSLCAELSLPEGFLPISSIALGYAHPDEAEKQKRPRQVAVNVIE